MAIDLNEPLPSDDDRVLASPVRGHQQKHKAVPHAHVGDHAWRQQQHQEDVMRGSHLVLPHALNLVTFVHVLDDKDVDAFNAAAEAARFDLNDVYESDEDVDAHVYAENFHVILGEGNLQGSSVEAYGEQGTRKNRKC